MRGQKITAILVLLLFCAMNLGLPNYAYAELANTEGEEQDISGISTEDLVGNLEKYGPILKAYVNGQKSAAEKKKSIKTLFDMFRPDTIDVSRMQQQFKEMTLAEITAKLTEMLKKMDEGSLDFYDFRDALYLSINAGQPEISNRIVSIMKEAFQNEPILAHFANVLGVICDPDIPNDSERAQQAVQKFVEFRAAINDSDFNPLQMRGLEDLELAVIKLIGSEFDQWLEKLTDIEASSYIGKTNGVKKIRALHEFKNSLLDYMRTSEQEIREVKDISVAEQPFLDFNLFNRYLGEKVGQTLDACAEIIQPNSSIRHDLASKNKLHKHVEDTIKRSVIATKEYPDFGISKHLYLEDSCFQGQCEENPCKYIALGTALRNMDEFFPHLPALLQMNDAETDIEKQEIILNYAVEKKYSASNASLELLTLLEENKDTLIAADGHTPQWHWNDIVGRANPDDWTGFNLPVEYEKELFILATSAAAGAFAGIGVGAYALRYFGANALKSLGMRLLVTRAIPLLVGTTPAFLGTHKILNTIILGKPLFTGWIDLAKEYLHAAALMAVLGGSGHLAKIAVSGIARPVVRSVAGSFLQTFAGASIVTLMDAGQMELFIEKTLDADEQAFRNGEGEDGFFYTQGYWETWVESLIAFAVMGVASKPAEAAGQRRFKTEAMLKALEEKVKGGIEGKSESEGESEPVEAKAKAKEEPVKKPGQGLYQRAKGLAKKVAPGKSVEKLEKEAAKKRDELDKVASSNEESIDTFVEKAHQTIEEINAEKAEGKRLTPLVKKVAVTVSAVKENVKHAKKAKKIKKLDKKIRKIEEKIDEKLNLKEKTTEDLEADLVEANAKLESEEKILEGKEKEVSEAANEEATTRRAKRKKAIQEKKAKDEMAKQENRVVEAEQRVIKIEQELKRRGEAQEGKDDEGPSGDDGGDKGKGGETEPGPREPVEKEGESESKADAEPTSGPDPEPAPSRGRRALNYLKSFLPGTAENLGKNAQKKRAEAEKLGEERNQMDSDFAKAQERAEQEARKAREKGEDERAKSIEDDFETYKREQATEYTAKGKRKAELEKEIEELEEKIAKKKPKQAEEEVKEDDAPAEEVKSKGPGLVQRARKLVGDAVESVTSVFKGKTLAEAEVVVDQAKAKGSNAKEIHDRIGSEKNEEAIKETAEKKLAAEKRVEDAKDETERAEAQAEVEVLKEVHDRLVADKVAAARKQQAEIKKAETNLASKEKAAQRLRDKNATKAHEKEKEIEGLKKAIEAEQKARDSKYEEDNEPVEALYKKIAAKKLKNAPKTEVDELKTQLKEAEALRDKNVNDKNEWISKLEKRKAAHENKKAELEGKEVVSDEVSGEQLAKEQAALDKLGAGKKLKTKEVLAVRARLARDAKTAETLKDVNKKLTLEELEKLADTEGVSEQTNGDSEPVDQISQLRAEIRGRVEQAEQGYEFAKKHRETLGENFVEQMRHKHIDAVEQAAQIEGKIRLLETQQRAVAESVEATREVEEWKESIEENPDRVEELAEYNDQTEETLVGNVRRQVQQAKTIAENLATESEPKGFTGKAKDQLRKNGLAANDAAREVEARLEAWEAQRADVKAAEQEVSTLESRNEYLARDNAVETIAAERGNTVGEAIDLLREATQTEATVADNLSKRASAQEYSTKNKEALEASNTRAAEVAEEIEVKLLRAEAREEVRDETNNAISSLERRNEALDNINHLREQSAATGETIETLAATDRLYTEAEVEVAKNALERAKLEVLGDDIVLELEAKVKQAERIAEAIEESIQVMEKPQVKPGFERSEVMDLYDEFVRTETARRAAEETADTRPTDQTEAGEREPVASESTPEADALELFQMLERGKIESAERASRSRLTDEPLVDGEGELTLGQQRDLLEFMELHKLGVNKDPVQAARYRELERTFEQQREEPVVQEKASPTFKTETEELAYLEGKKTLDRTPYENYRYRQLKRAQAEKAKPGVEEKVKVDSDEGTFAEQAEFTVEMELAKLEEINASLRASGGREEVAEVLAPEASASEANAIIAEQVDAMVARTQRIAELVDNDASDVPLAISLKARHLQAELAGNEIKWRLRVLGENDAANTDAYYARRAEIGNELDGVAYELNRVAEINVYNEKVSELKELQARRDRVRRDVNEPRLSVFEQQDLKVLESSLGENPRELRLPPNARERAEQANRVEKELRRARQKQEEAEARIREDMLEKLHAKRSELMGRQERGEVRRNPMDPTWAERISKIEADIQSINEGTLHIQSQDGVEALGIKSIPIEAVPKQVEVDPVVQKMSKDLSLAEIERRIGETYNTIREAKEAGRPNLSVDKLYALRMSEMDLLKLEAARSMKIQNGDSYGEAQKVEPVVETVGTSVEAEVASLAKTYPSYMLNKKIRLLQKQIDKIKDIPTGDRDANDIFQLNKLERQKLRLKNAKKLKKKQQ